MTKSKKGSSRAKKNNMGGRKIKGRGNYATFNLRGMAQKLDQALCAIPKGTFARKGAQMGAKYGPLGALAGKGLGAGLAAVTGYGNYSVRSNSLSRVSTSVDMVPQFVKNDHSIRVTHREFIKDLIVPAAPVDFTLQAQLINPANRELFPWLATMARQYSQYKIHGMVFAYKTMSSDITAGGSLGTVIMATNYNAIDRSFLTKIEMENSEFAVSTKPSMSLIHAIECDPKYSGLDVLYVRDPSYNTLDTDDRRFYDYGKFQVATTGLPGAPGTTMGELWVSYDIEFMKPIIGGTGQPPLISGTTVISRVDGSYGVGVTSRPLRANLTAATETPVPSAVASVLASTYPTIDGDSGIVGTAVNFSGNTIVFKRNGNFTVSVGLTGATTTTRILYPDTNSVHQVNFSVTTVGGSAGTLRRNGGGTVPGLSNGIVSETGYGYNFSFNIIVTGATDLTPVTVTPSTFPLTGSATGIVANVTKNANVVWVATGTNEQTPAYVG